MLRRAAVVASFSFAVVRIASAQLAADPDYVAAQIAWSKADYSAVIAGATRVLEKPGNALNVAYADARYLRAAAWCRTEPATITSRSEGQKQLAALVSDLEPELQPGASAPGTSSPTREVVRKAQYEQTKCVSVADSTSFGSLDMRPASTPKVGEPVSGGQAGAGGTVLTAAGDDGPTGQPGVTGTLKESDLLLQKDVLDLRIQQLQTDQRLQRLQRGIQGSGLPAR